MRLDEATAVAERANRVDEPAAPRPLAREDHEALRLVRDVAPRRRRAEGQNRLRRAGAARARREGRQGDQ